MIQHGIYFVRNEDDELVYVTIPEGVSFDGVYQDRAFFAFTDRDPSSPAYGASFELHAASLTTESLAKTLAEKRAQFDAARGDEEVPFYDRFRAIHGV